MADTPDSPTPKPPPSVPKHHARPYDLLQPQINRAVKKYWRTNVCVMLALLVVWALIGLGCGVLWADKLNALTVGGEPFRLGGFPLGFWFAQQGSIIVFVLLILTYAVFMNRLDRSHHLEIKRLRRERSKG